MSGYCVLSDFWLVKTRFILIWLLAILEQAFPANTSCFPRPLEDIFSITIFHLPRISSSRCIQDVLARCFPNTSPRHLQDVFKISSRRLPGRLQDVLTRRLQEYVLQTCLEDVFKDKICYPEDVFNKTSCLQVVYWYSSSLYIVRASLLNKNRWTVRTFPKGMLNGGGVMGVFKIAAK